MTLFTPRLNNLVSKLLVSKRLVTGGPVKSTRCESIIILTRKESFFFGWEEKVH